MNVSQAYDQAYDARVSQQIEENKADETLGLNESIIPDESAAGIIEAAAPE